MNYPDSELFWFYASLWKFFFFFALYAISFFHSSSFPLSLPLSSAYKVASCLGAMLLCARTLSYPACDTGCRIAGPICMLQSFSRSSVSGDFPTNTSRPQATRRQDPSFHVDQLSIPHLRSYSFDGNFVVLRQLSTYLQDRRQLQVCHVLSCYVVSSLL